MKILSLFVALLMFAFAIVAAVAVFQNNNERWQDCMILTIFCYLSHEQLTRHMDGPGAR